MLTLCPDRPCGRSRGFWVVVNYRDFLREATRSFGSFSDILNGHGMQELRATSSASAKVVAL